MLSEQICPEVEAGDLIYLMQATGEAAQLARTAVCVKRVTHDGRIEVELGYKFKACISQSAGDKWRKVEFHSNGNSNGASPKKRNKNNKRNHKREREKL